MTVTYSFCSAPAVGCLPVHPALLFGQTQPFGFVTEKNRASEPELLYPELTCGFDVPYWYRDTPLTHIRQDFDGCYLDEADIPLCFQAEVCGQGNYLAEITLFNPSQTDTPFLLFTGRRRLAAVRTLKAASRITLKTQINVSDIIPRGQTLRKTDKSINISLIGAGIRLCCVALTPSRVPTLFIAGDSTVTDQSGDYPYRPEQCYSGWGQALPIYLKPTVSLSNHAHSGLTTESFREEGHYAIVLDAIRPGDYFFMQFAHNDQKLDHLKAEEGYRQNLIRYIEEIRSRRAYPVLVTPLGRNTWKGIDGTYNDLLAEYADVCRRLAGEYGVPLIDLHRASTDFIRSHGLEDSRRFFYPGDYTHTNDCGAVLMAGFAAGACRQFSRCEGYEPLADSISMPAVCFMPPQTIRAAQPPEGFADDRPKQSGAAFPRTIERPDDPITRAEALSLLIQAVHFFPTNVYNDMYKDVVGHEWYAGTIECACQNGMIDSHLVKDGCIGPNRFATLEEFLSMAVNACASRRTIPGMNGTTNAADISWTAPYLAAAQRLGWLDAAGADQAAQTITRERARDLAQKVSDWIG